MTDRFNELLNECLESLSSGRRTLEECLAAYPEEAARLEPLLRTALSLNEAFSAEPRPEFVAAARQRFLRVTPQALKESLRVEPQPSFVAAARQRFLEAAQQMVLIGKSRSWRLPSLPRPSLAMRPLAASVCGLLLLLTGFGGAVVVSAGDAVPGDWRYPVKRATEEVRLKLAFGEGARREVKVGFAHERLYEIETLTAEGRPIGDSLLSDLEDNTNSVVKSLDDSGWKAADAAQVADLAKKQQEILASAAPLVKPEAQDELAEAQEASNEALVSALSFSEETTAGPTAVPTTTPAPATTATASVTPSPEGGELTPTPQPETTVEPSPVPPTPEAPQVTPIPGSVIRVHLPSETAAGLSWDLIVIDRFSVQVPSEASGWLLDGLDSGSGNVGQAPSLLRVVSADQRAIIVINPRTGDTYWYQYKDGFFEDLAVRATTGSVTWQADEETIRSFYPENADVVLHLVNSIVIAPAPTPTETPPPPPATPTLTGGAPSA